MALVSALATTNFSVKFLMDYHMYEFALCELSCLCMSCNDVKDCCDI